MRIVLLTLGFLLVLASCEPYEPVMKKDAAHAGSSAEAYEEEEETTTTGQHIMAYASGVEYVLYFASDTMKFAPLYQGTAPYSANIEIPEHTPLDLWLVTIPATQDSVRLDVGCIQINTVNRIRMVMKN